jgi:hypothetical protein
MAVHRLLSNIISGVADADLSSNQFRIVCIGDDGDVAVPATNATMPVGILLNKPAAAGRACRIAAAGCIVKCEAGAAINERAFVQAVAGGRGSAAASGTPVYVVGVAHTAASGSGVMFELEVRPGAEAIA